MTYSETDEPDATHQVADVPLRYDTVRAMRSACRVIDIVRGDRPQECGAPLSAKDGHASEALDSSHVVQESMCPHAEQLAVSSRDRVNFAQRFVRNEACVVRRDIVGAVRGREVGRAVAASGWQDTAHRPCDHAQALCVQICDAYCLNGT